jgi:hypothetical protein
VIVPEKGTGSGGGARHPFVPKDIGAILAGLEASPVRGDPLLALLVNNGLAKPASRWYVEIVKRSSGASRTSKRVRRRGLAEVENPCTKSAPLRGFEYRIGTVLLAKFFALSCARSYILTTRQTVFKLK